MVYYNTMKVIQVRGKLLAVMAVVLVLVFVMFMSQFYNTDPNVSVNFHLKQQVTDNANIAGISNNKLLVDSEDSKRNIYAVVFDAGSTGSRVHIFHFTVESPGSELKLIAEVFEQVKPGLSSYEKEPHEGALSLRGMLDQCKAVVPPELYKVTPITLKATAGLRLLSEGAADNLLNEVKVLIKTYPFMLPEDGIGIMDGVDEGVFSWMTVNFMLGFLKKGIDTVAALDLGGGSTQITLVPKLQSTIDAAPAGYMKNITLFHDNYNLYTHSYLKLGLMSARFTSLGGDDIVDKVINKPLSGPCIPVGHSSTWTFAGNTYNISGAQYGEFTYTKCEALIRKLVEGNVQPLKELQSQYLYIFSYFYDIALDAELIQKDGGVILLEDYQKHAEIEFSLPNKDKAFMAFDLTYAYSLLRYGYGIEDTAKLYLEKKINGVEVSWGLGAAFQLLSSAHQAR